MTKILEGKRVLVVEDEMLILMTIESALAELGCNEIRAAATVNAAQARLDSERFDLVLLDMNLNGQMSHAVADTLVLRDIPFAFSTGYSDIGIETRFRGRPVLTKPYCLSELTAVIAALLVPTTPMTA
jgi:CheY-like chemotaxis protein